MKIYLEHGSANFARNVSGSELLNLLRKQLGAAHRLDDDIQTGQNGVGLGKEVAVAQQLILGNIGEGLEFLLVFGMSLQETVDRYIEI